MKNRLRFSCKSGGASGFTIVELMIATMVFSIVLLVIAVGVLRFTNAYFKGINSSKTQAAARAVMSQVAQSIQFSKVVTPLARSGNTDGICVDNTLYSFVVGQQVTDVAPNGAKHQGYHGLVVSNPGSCSVGITPNVPASSALPSGSRELLGQHMRLGALDVSPAGKLYKIHVRVIYGDDDLLTPAVSAGTDWANEVCSGATGEQFCAVSDLTTTVEQRLL